MARAPDGDADLRAQYEAFPYPARDPRDEAKRLIAGSPSHIAEINHYLFGGRRDFTRGFRALFAGGGTGDGTIMLAQQLADAGGDAEIQYIDLSRAALDIARARARTRGLKNIRFSHGSLLDLSGLGTFDYIDCCGVLHHLDDPTAGLATLADALNPGGGLGLMVYGALGRTGVYDIQELLRRLGAAEPDLSPKDRVRIARRLLDTLPDTNRFKRNSFVNDHLQGGDAGLYDLLLHSRDRAYRVAEVFALAAGAGVEITGFIEPARYDPTTYMRDAKIRDQAAALSWPESCAVAELAAGSIKRHVFYATPGSADGRVAVPTTPDAIPMLRKGNGHDMAKGLRPGGTLTADLENLRLSYPLPRLGPAILSRVDGVRTLGEIHQSLRESNDGLGWEKFKKEFDALYGPMNALNVMLIRYRNDPRV